jgi:hypothetical protein
LYPTYGDYNVNTPPPRPLMSVDPSTGASTEHLATTNTNWYMVYPMESDIVATYVDTTGETPAIAKRVSGVWSQHPNSDISGQHVFDAIVWNGDWYVCGAGPVNLALDSTPGVVWKSTDNGATWTTDLSVGGAAGQASRIYAFFPYDDRLYVQHVMNFNTQTGAWWLPTTGGTWTFDAAARPLQTDDTPMEVRRFGSRLYYHGTLGGMSLQTNTGEWKPSAITTPIDLKYVPTDRSTAEQKAFDDIWSYDVTDDGTRMYMLAQDGLLYTSTDGTTFTAVLSGERLPGQLRAVACVGNEVYLGTHGGQIYKGVSTAWSTSDIVWETFHNDPTSRGWVLVDQSTPAVSFRESQFIRSDASSTGAASAVPRLYWNTPQTRVAGRTFEMKVNRANDAYYFAGFGQSAGGGYAGSYAAFINDAGRYRLHGGSGNAIPICNPTGVIGTKWPGYEIRVVLLATGYNVYGRGFEFPSTYDDRNAARGRWAILGRNRTEAQATGLYPIWNSVGAVAKMTNIDYMRVLDIAAPTETVVDTFTRADGALGSAETGGAYDTTGTWTVSSNQAMSTDTSGVAIRAVIDSNLADGLLEVTISNVSATSFGGLVFRRVDANNYWSAFYNGTNFQVEKFVAGVGTNVFTVADAATGGTISVTMCGPSITIHRGTNGATHTTDITSTDLQTADIHGMFLVQTTTNIRFDNLRLWGSLAP